MEKFRKNITLFVLGLAIFVVVLDGTFMNIAMNAIVKDLSTSLESVQAMITIYSAIMASFTLIGARLGDKIGRKRIFLIGTILFGLGALLASFAINSIMLLIGWSIIEGIGASLMMPATLAVLASDFHGKDRAFGLGLWGAISAIGAAFGPILGGYLTTNYSWRIAFLIEIFPILIVLALSRFIPDPRNYLVKKRLDIKGSIVSALSLGMLIYALLYANNYGWFKPIHKTGILGLSFTSWLIIFSIILFIFFIKIEKKCIESRNCTPLIELSIFKNKTFSISLFIALIITIVQAGALLVLPIFLLTFRQFSAMQVSLAMLPLMVAVIIATLLGSKFYKHKKVVTLLGLIITMLSAVLLKNKLTEISSLNSIATGLVVLGFGIGLITSQLTNITISAVNIKKAGEASGLNSTIRRFGAALGTAIMGTVLFSFLGTNFINQLNLYAQIPAVTQNKITQQITDGKPINKNTFKELNIKQEQAAKTAYNKAFILATKKTLDVMLLFLLPAVIAVFLLPHDKELAIER